LYIFFCLLKFSVLQNCTVARALLPASQPWLAVAGFATARMSHTTAKLSKIPTVKVAGLSIAQGTKIQKPYL
jgi:hypothetical protein